MAPSDLTQQLLPDLQPRPASKPLLRRLCARCASVRPPWQTPAELQKLSLFFSFFFCKSTILLLGRNAGATLFLARLDAGYLPYCMISVGVIVWATGDSFSKYAKARPPTTVMQTLTAIFIALLGVFYVCFILGLDEQAPILVCASFYVMEEVLVTLMMLTFWQIAMLSFTPREAKRMLGMVNMGGCLASTFNGLLVSLIIAWCPGGATALILAQVALLLLQLVPNALAVQFTTTIGGKPSGGGSKPKPKPSASAASANSSSGGGDEPLANEQVRLMAFWSLGVSCVFSLIEFQYNATLAEHLDPPSMAKVTGTMASVAGIVQALSNLLLTPLVLQKAGVGAALLVTPAMYALAEAAIALEPGVPAVFAARTVDFAFRYTINDAVRQIIWLAVPPSILIPSKALVDNTIKKMSPAVVGVTIIVLQQAARQANWPADMLVRCLAVGALAVSVALLPLCIRLGRAYFEQIREQITSRALRLGGSAEQFTLSRVDLRDVRVLRLLAARLQSSTESQLLALLDGMGDQLPLDALQGELRALFSRSASTSVRLVLLQLAGDDAAIFGDALLCQLLASPTEPLEVRVGAMLRAAARQLPDAVAPLADVLGGANDAPFLARAAAAVALLRLAADLEGGGSGGRLPPSVEQRAYDLLRVALDGVSLSPLETVSAPPAPPSSEAMKSLALRAAAAPQKTPDELQAEWAAAIEAADAPRACELALEMTRAKLVEQQAQQQLQTQQTQLQGAPAPLELTELVDASAAEERAIATVNLLSHLPKGAVPPAAKLRLINSESGRVRRAALALPTVDELEAEHGAPLLRASLACVEHAATLSRALALLRDVSASKLLPLVLDRLSQLPTMPTTAGKERTRFTAARLASSSKAEAVGLEAEEMAEAAASAAAERAAGKQMSVQAVYGQLRALVLLAQGKPAAPALSSPDEAPNVATASLAPPSAQLAAGVGPGWAVWTALVGLLGRSAGSHPQLASEVVSSLLKLRKPLGRPSWKGAAAVADDGELGGGGAAASSEALFSGVAATLGARLHAVYVGALALQKVAAAEAGKSEGGAGPRMPTEVQVLGAYLQEMATALQQDLLGLLVCAFEKGEGLPGGGGGGSAVGAGVSTKVFVATLWSSLKSGGRAGSTAQELLDSFVPRGLRHLTTLLDPSSPIEQKLAQVRTAMEPQLEPHEQQQRMLAQHATLLSMLRAHSGTVAASIADFLSAPKHIAAALSSPGAGEGADAGPLSTVLRLRALRAVPLLRHAPLLLLSRLASLSVVRRPATAGEVIESEPGVSLVVLTGSFTLIDAAGRPLFGRAPLGPGECIAPLAMLNPSLPTHRARAEGRRASIFGGSGGSGGGGSGALGAVLAVRCADLFNLFSCGSPDFILPILKAVVEEHKVPSLTLAAANDASAASDTTAAGPAAAALAAVSRNAVSRRSSDSAPAPNLTLRRGRSDISHSSSSRADAAPNAFSPDYVERGDGDADGDADGPLRASAEGGRRYSAFEVLMLLRRTPLFAHVSEEHANLVAGITTEVRHAAGATLFEEGDAADQTLHIVAEGKLELLRDGQRLKTIAVGDTVGNRGLLVDEPKDYTVRAVAGGGGGSGGGGGGGEVDTWTLVLRRDGLRSLMRGHTSLARALLSSFLVCFTSALSPLPAPEQGSQGSQGSAPSPRPGAGPEAGVSLPPSPMPLIPLERGRSVSELAAGGGSTRRDSTAAGGSPLAILRTMRKAAQ